MGEGEWFQTFCGNLRIPLTKRAIVGARTERITAQLNFDVRGISSNSSNRFYVGSYGRNTAIPSVSDVDLLYEMPPSFYTRYNAYIGNGQSALLAFVRASIIKTYPATRVGGDGQVVVIDFSDGIKYEVLPAFKNTLGSYTFADANNSGTWKSCNPKAEMDAFSTRDLLCNWNLRELAKMARAWRDTNNVSMSGMLIDTLAYQFINDWPYKDKSYLYYDFLTRDFFEFLSKQSPAQNFWSAPGSGSRVYGSGFQFKARQAYLRAMEALEYQARNFDYSARQKYRTIYGSSFPT